MDKIVKLIKVVDYWNEREFYYYVDDGSHRHFFYNIVDAEIYIRDNLKAKYEFKEIKDFLIY